MIEDRPRHLFRQDALDLPDNLLALLDIRFLRLIVEKVLDVTRAVSCVIGLGLTRVGTLSAQRPDRRSRPPALRL